MRHYSVKQLAEMAGVSIRTLHLYDKIGILKPSVRTGARYRLYGEKELLQLQQILFYRELEFSLKEIGDILHDPGFDIIKALESHKEALKTRKQRMETLLVTIDRTIHQLKKGGVMLKPEDLYEGLPKETAAAYRKEAIEKYGRDTIEKSETGLLKLSKEEFNALKEESKEVWDTLFSLMYEDPHSEHVQKVISRHYSVIRRFWGTAGSTDKQAEAYAGLGQLYVNDERFTMIEGKPQPGFALFLSRAMAYFSGTSLK